jgi:hypothetical protein
MRYLLLSSALLLAGIVSVAAAETPAPAKTIQRTIYLDSVVLEDLKKSNPARYAKVQSVMASASEMCKPNAARTWALANSVANAPSPDCSTLFLKTSYPPKRQIQFIVDDTLYVANVIVRDAPALTTPVPGQVIPLDQSK